MRMSRSTPHFNKWEIMRLSCFSSTPYNLAAVPFAGKNRLNQIRVPIPIAVVKLLESMCRKLSGLLPLPQRRRGTAVRAVTSVRSAERDVRSPLQRWQMLVPLLPNGATQILLRSVVAFSMEKVQIYGITPSWLSFYIKICLQFSVICSLGTNISTVNMVLWEPNLDYRHSWLRFLS